MAYSIRSFFKPAYRSLVLCAMILVGVLAGFIYGVVPSVRRVMELWDTRNKVTAESRTLQKKLALLQSMDEETLQKHVAVLFSAVPQEKSVASIFSTIENVAGETGLAISSFSIGSPGTVATESAVVQGAQEKHGGSSFLVVSVSAEGTPQGVNNFLDKMVTVRRFFRVRSFSLSWVSPERLTLRATVEAFFAPAGSARIGMSQLEPLSPREEELLVNVSSLPLYGLEIGTLVAPSAGLSARDPFSP